MLAGQRGNDLSLVTSSETFYSLKYSGYTPQEREHFWSCSAPQNRVGALMRGKTDQWLQSCQQVISYLGTTETLLVAHRFDCRGVWSRHSQTCSICLNRLVSGLTFNLIRNLGESKAVSKNYIKYISFIIANHLFLNTQSRRFSQFWKISVIIQIWSKNSAIWGRNSHDTLKETGDIQELFFHFGWMFSDGSNLSVICLISITLIQYLIFINFLRQPKLSKFEVLVVSAEQLDARQKGAGRPAICYRSENWIGIY